MLLKTAKSEDSSFRSSGYWTFLRQNQTKNSALVDSVDMAWSAWHIISAWPGWHENSEPLVGVCYSLPLPSPLGTLSNIACLLVTFPIFICYISSILTCLLIHRSHYKSLRFLAATTHPSSPLSSFLGASPALVSLGIPCYQPGFTATLVPSFSTARCTCANDAEAIGSSSMLCKS